MSGTDDRAYRFIVENATDLIVLGDAARRRVFVSPSAKDMLGHDPQEMLGKHAYELVHPDDLVRVSATFGKIGRDFPAADLRFRMRRADGSYIWVDARYRHLPEDNGVLAILRDITAQKQAEDSLAEAHAELRHAHEALRELADRDGLTGLANRRRFDEVLVREFRRARREEQPLGLVLMDVDNFKAYNDHYGHLAGDDCLRRVGAAIQGAVRRPGDHVARFGGEEIVALLPATDLAGTVIMAERMREAVLALEIRHHQGSAGVASVSAGATALLPLTAEIGPLDLVEAADRALYRAKESGRNRVQVADPAGVMTA